jgi:release factor glutamine methyltransferase
VAIALAKSLAGAAGVAIDASAAAIEIAQRNAEKHAVADRLTFRVLDIRDPPADSDRFDLVVSNPPYVTTSEMAELPATVRDHEPRAALDGGADGLELTRRVVENAGRRLRPGGALMFEIGATQAESSLALVAASRAFASAAIIKDLAGTPRVCRAIRNR